MELPQLELHTFSRGAPEPIKNIKHPQWTASLYDLLSAYGVQRQKQALSQVRFKKRQVWTLAEARQQIERLIGATDDWNRLDQFLITYLVEPSMVATVTASSFASTLEMVREGVIELQQHAAFAPLYIRKSRVKGPEKSGASAH
jgi:segregation and condensation protein A